jgi:rRNA-processing protein FCF1
MNFELTEIKKKFEILNIKNIDFEKQNIIFDTNFLFLTFQFKFDIIRELERIFGFNYRLLVFEGSFNELERLNKRKSKNRKLIPVIIKMLEFYNFKIISSIHTYVDNDILKNLDKRIIVATNDKLLKRKILNEKKNVKILYMRKKSYLKLE